MSHHRYTYIVEAQHVDDVRTATGAPFTLPLSADGSTPASHYATTAALSDTERAVFVADMPHPYIEAETDPTGAQTPSETFDANGLARIPPATE